MCPILDALFFHSTKQIQILQLVYTLDGFLLHVSALMFRLQEEQRVSFLKTKRHTKLLSIHYGSLFISAILHWTQANLVAIYTTE